MTVKLNSASGGGSVSIDAPTSTTSNAAVTFKLPVADGTSGQVLKTDGSGNLSWVTVTSHPTVVDRFRLTDHTTAGGELVIGGGTQSSLEGRTGERNDTTTHLPGFITTGGQITDSTGVFSFPSTGIYSVVLHASIQSAGSDTIAQIWIQVTDDNATTWRNASMGRHGHTTTTEIHNAIDADFIIDVTNTSNHKVRFKTDSFSGGTQVRGSTTADQTWVNFIRLGDT